MRAIFILAQISSPKASEPTTEASGGRILTNVKATQAPLCRPAGWIALWRRIGNLSVLNRMARA
jgi:hypothetical protein